MDARLEEALGSFRTSVHAWSESAMRPAAVFAAPPAHRLAWHRTVAWALGVLLTVGTASGALYERHHQQVLRAQEQQRQFEQQQRALAAQRATDMDELLARVDQDVSQEVPDALEPLAQMMAEDGSSK
ncbi:MAG TPA: hypothetical protein VG267_14990 [Terracidiphilus sp.]|nr:hypothetical protein [Terracidiphilus sp.]